MCHHVAPLWKSPDSRHDQADGGPVHASGMRVFAAALFESEVMATALGAAQASEDDAALFAVVGAEFRLSEAAWQAS